MKKALLITLLVVMAAAIAAAQVTGGSTAMTTGSAGSVAPLVDVLGAHNNYGRGCAGCHAPHSGARGAGGNAVSGSTSDAMTGANALFAQDMGPLYNQTFDFSDISNTGSANRYTFHDSDFGYHHDLDRPAIQRRTWHRDVPGLPRRRGCQGRHDAELVLRAADRRSADPLTAPAHIPTLLGADGSTAGYNNDHPVGESATLQAALGTAYYNTAERLNL